MVDRVDSVDFWKSEFFKMVFVVIGIFAFAFYLYVSSSDDVIKFSTFEEREFVEDCIDKCENKNEWFTPKSRVISLKRDVCFCQNKKNNRITEFEE